MNKPKIYLLLVLSFIPSYLFSQNYDIELLRTINTPYTLHTDSFFQFVSNSNVYIVVGIPTAIGTVGLFKKDEKLLRNAFITAGASVVNFGITAALKYSVNRTRPYITYPDIMQKSPVHSPSFPSGHTSSAFATATSISLSYPKWYVIVPLYGWAGTVGYSRMYLGVHYPSDVLAGAAIGAGTAWLSHYVNKKLIIKPRKKPTL